MAKQPKTYTAPHAVYVDSRLYKAGEPFTTAAEKGENWELADAKEVAAAEASSKTTTVQPSLEKLDLAALKARAVEKGVDTVGLTKKADLITAIKAADEPAL